MIKEIGRIRLDYECYPGKDLYCDGSVEDEILDIVRNHNEDEYAAIISERKSWPVMYHLSQQRKNAVEWIDIGKDETVLEIGSGCGAVTGAFATKAKSVTCIELSEKRSLINAYRHKDYDNIEILLGNFEDVEKKLAGRKYDVVTLIGVLEYGGSYINAPSPYAEFLKTAKNHVKPGGRLIIAIENKFGLKYFAGCKEDHVGGYYAGIEGYNDNDKVRTFSKDELCGMIKEAGFAGCEFYYPYPDYKFATMVYSDEYLPKEGELWNNYRNFDMERMYTFNELKVFDQLIRDGKFTFFSNSFLVQCFN